MTSFEPLLSTVEKNKDFDQISKVGKRICNILLLFLLELILKFFAKVIKSISAQYGDIKNYKEINLFIE